MGIDEKRLKVAKAEQKLRQSRQELAEEILASEPPEASVVRFQMRFSGNPRLYDYAAIRTNNRWYTTGYTCPRSGFSWVQLINGISGGTVVGPIREMV